MNTKLERKVNELKAILVQKVKSCYYDNLEAWWKQVYYVLDHVDQVTYGIPLVENLLSYVRMQTEYLQRIDDAVVLNTQNALVMDLIALLKRKGECTLSAFLMADASKVIRPGSPHLYRGYRCQLRQNNHSKTLALTLDDMSDDKEKVLTKILNLI